MDQSRPDDRCPNCSTALSAGPYCPSCGQHQRDLDRPFREVVGEGLSAFVAFDTRIGRTLWPLIRRPGELTSEFLAGRRARYVHPFKLYFALSLVFFFVFSFADYTIIHTNEPGVISITSLGEEPAGQVESGTLDSSMSLEGEDTDRIDRFFAPLVELAENDPGRFDGLFIDRLSTSLIALVPMVALLLQLLYWKPRYVAHLVFSLHLHSFAFLVLIIGALVDASIGLMGLSGKGIGNNVATLSIAIYAFSALRRVYGQGRLITVLKLVTLIFGYVLALVLTMLATLIVTVASL